MNQLKSKPIPQSELWPEQDAAGNRQTLAELLAEAAAVTQAASQLFPYLDTTNKHDIRNALEQLYPKLQRAAQKAKNKKSKSP